jgi:hypothetical protein
MLLGPDKSGSARCAMRQRRDQTSQRQTMRSSCLSVCSHCTRLARSHQTVVDIPIGAQEGDMAGLP